jgi:transcriptional regulator with XRE-family HTH domain
LLLWPNSRTYRAQAIVRWLLGAPSSGELDYVKALSLYTNRVELWMRQAQALSMSHQKASKKTIKSPFAIMAGKRIRDCRNAAELTQDELAQLTGNKLSASRIANYEQGTRALDVESALILGEALQQPAGYLLGVLSDLERDLVSAPASAKFRMLTIAREAAFNTQSV